MLTLLNLNREPPPPLSKIEIVRKHYARRRKAAHRARLCLETLSTVFVAIETHLLLFGVISILWTLVDATMLIADDLEE